MEFHIRTFLFNTMCFICRCVFIIFEIQSAIFQKSIARSMPPPAQYTSNEMEIHQTSYPILNENQLNKTKHWDIRDKRYKVPQIWIAMGLCWSGNAQYYGKENFPYKEAAPLSAQLWMHLSSSIKVILLIVYSESEPSKVLTEYKKTLEKFGTIVKLVPRASKLTCVLESQLIRIMAYLLPEVIILTSNNRLFSWNPQHHFKIFI